MKHTLCTRLAAALLLALLPADTLPAPPIEIREYRGERLDPYERDYDNSIRGSQHVDPRAYRLVIDGAVAAPRSLTYDEVLRLPPATRTLTLHCVEGWQERLLFEGVRLVDLIGPAQPGQDVRTVIFHAADGYSSALPWSFVQERNLLLVSRINGLVLDSRRGFPFQVAAESKYGYKWVKWVVRIELSAKEYLGYWESRGYGNDAEVK